MGSLRSLEDVDDEVWVAFGELGVVYKAHEEVSAIPNGRLCVDLPLAEQLSDSKGLTSVPSVVLGNVVDGGYVEA